MDVLPPPGYLSLRDARDMLTQRMHEGVPPSDKRETIRIEGVELVDAAQAAAAAEALRRPILVGELGLFAIFSSRDTPMRLHNRALISAALSPPNSTVLTFAFCDRHSQAPFGLSWSDLEELTRDPLCIEEKAFHAWLRKQARKKVWPCDKHAGSTRRTPGRPSDLMDQLIEVIEELDANGQLTPAMRNKEVHALVQRVRPSLQEVSEETVRRARKQANLGRSPI